MWLGCCEREVKVLQLPDLHLDVTLCCLKDRRKKLWDERWSQQSNLLPKAPVYLLTCSAHPCCSPPASHFASTKKTSCKDQVY